MGPRVIQHNVAGGWMDTAGEQTYGVSAAATDIPAMVHGYNLGHRQYAQDKYSTTIRRLDLSPSSGGIRKGKVSV